MRKILAAAIGGALLTGQASASVITTFSFWGDAKAGSDSATFTDFAEDGAYRVTDPDRNFTAVLGQGALDPFIYAAGAAVAGYSSASANVLVSMQITNDTGFTAGGSLAGLIFPGAVGIANPDFTQPNCTTAAIEACGVFLDGTPQLHAGESAAVTYAALLDGQELFGGAISVSSAGMSATTSGVALNGFGISPVNGNLFTWQETVFSGLSLGTFAPGETKSLSFLVSVNVATNGLYGCSMTAFACPVALAGFGDPPPGNGGVIIDNSSAARIASAASTATSGTGGLVIKPFTGFSPSFSVNFERDPSVVPLPGAVYLFGLGLSGLAFQTRRAKKKAAAT